jgi:diguanylate cyclase (GGDEF)-like protein
MLTGLINRNEFERRLERVLSSSQDATAEHALCYMDLDQFKVINDTCGHIAGDELLRTLGGVLKKRIRKRDSLARLGGDEFAVLMEHCSLPQAQKVAKDLIKDVGDFRFIWEGKNFSIGISIGLVPIIQADNVTELLKRADIACYAAKDAGRNRVHVYLPEDEAMSQRHGEMQWVSQINHALEENRFQLYAQSIEPLAENTVSSIHVEFLLRMNLDGKIISPGRFLPAAERYYMASKIDRWVIDSVFNMLVNNPGFLSRLYVGTVNISGQSIAEPDFLDYVVRRLKAFAIPGNKICFEITETAAISNLANASRFIHRVKKFGCKFALDDFGSGLSSFGYLKTLPVDYLKIDGLFVKDIVDDKIDFAMVKSIHEIAHVMGKATIAEFVESEAIKNKLREIGVDYVQGFAISRPRSVEELLRA